MNLIDEFKRDLPRTRCEECIGVMERSIAELERLSAENKELKREPYIQEQQRLHIERLEAKVERLEGALAFYGDPTVYHGIAILADRPTGGFDEDLSDNLMYDYPKPGKLAREVLGFEPEFNPEAFPEDT